MQRRSVRRAWRLWRGRAPRAPYAARRAAAAERRSDCHASGAPARAGPRPTSRAVDDQRFELRGPVQGFEWRDRGGDGERVRSHARRCAAGLPLARLRCVSSQAQSAVVQGTLCATRCSQLADPSMQVTVWLWSPAMRAASPSCSTHPPVPSSSAATPERFLPLGCIRSRRCWMGGRHWCAGSSTESASEPGLFFCLLVMLKAN